MDFSHFLQQNIYYILFGILALLLLKNRLLSKIHGIQGISTAEAYGIYRKKSGKTVFLDVRTPWELEREPRIKNSKSIPLADLKGRFNELRTKDGADKQIIVVCRSANRARNAAVKLKKAGFSDISVMNGGMVGWLRSDYPVTRPKVKRTIG